MNPKRRVRPILAGLVMVAAISLAQSVPDDAENWLLETYQGNRDQFTLDIPNTWKPIDQSPHSSVGVIAFYSQLPFMQMDKDATDREEQEEAFSKLVNDIESGAAPSFLVDRYKAGKGMSCTGFSERGQKRKLDTYKKAPAFGKGAKIVGNPEVSKVEFAGCQGLKIRMRAEVRDGSSLEMLAYTVAVDDLTYDFVLLNDASYFEQNRPWFERIMATVRLTGAL